MVTVPNTLSQWPSGSQALRPLRGTQEADGTLPSGLLVREDHRHLLTHKPTLHAFLQSSHSHPTKHMLFLGIRGSPAPFIPTSLYSATTSYVTISAGVRGQETLCIPKDLAAGLAVSLGSPSFLSFGNRLDSPTAGVSLQPSLPLSYNV